MSDRLLDELELRICNMGGANVSKSRVRCYEIIGILRERKRPQHYIVPPVLGGGVEPEDGEPIWPFFRVGAIVLAVVLGLSILLAWVTG